MTELNSVEPWHDFSVVLGGPVFHPSVLQLSRIQPRRLEWLEA